MDVELSEVRDFLAEHDPFRELPATILDELPSRLQLRYHRRGTVLMEVGRPNNTLYILRSGAADIVDATGTLVERTEPGDSFGASSLLSKAPSRYTITAVEDSLVLVMGSEVFQHLVDHFPHVRDHYDQQADGRLRRAVAVQQSADRSSAAWLRTRVDDIGTADPHGVAASLSIQDAARVMTQHRISALLVTESEHMRGIITDRDLRSKVVAQALDVSLPVSRIMTNDPVHVPPGTQAFEALLEMTSRGVHHLPVVEDGRAVRIVTSGDIVRLQQTDPVFLVADISRQKDVAALSRLAARTPSLVAQLLRQDASAHDISRLLSTFADALTRRLIHFAEQDLGPAPGPWAWIALGSQARRELSVHSDQDHALVVADGVLDSPGATDWFAQLAERVTSGLAQCGQELCPGEVMASNPTWRMSVSQWRRQFAQWIHEPSAEAVLHSQIFFDARTVHGDPALLAAIRSETLAATPRAARFLGHLASQAVERQPPVGFFRGLVLAAKGEEAETFDMKADGVHAIIEIARVHALAQGIDAVGTLDRLRIAAAHGAPSLADLTDAFEFVTHVRLAHQSRQLEQGLTPDNIVRADSLSNFDKRHLKDSFAVIRKAQEGLSYSYQTHLMS
ncbi:DUF294 nucleotidyltransferase-like domain-containing protein [Luteococcus sp. OSA5]|uniref:DUF294 nucleotidyltransferase-like domain-containing protein n=1 Tax=Luteococcus sp. OSA5 TaxID=3401630 RepID=UPI003B42CE5F